MINLLSLTSVLEEIQKQLDKLAYKMDSPFTGMIIFIVLLTVSFIVIRSYSSK